MRVKKTTSENYRFYYPKMSDGHNLVDSLYITVNLEQRR